MNEKKDRKKSRRRGDLEEFCFCIRRESRNWKNQRRTKGRVEKIQRTFSLADTIGLSMKSDDRNVKVEIINRLRREISINKFCLLVNNSRI